jgi:KUP system potassium uptake protein
VSASVRPPRSPVVSLLGAPVLGALGVVFGDIGTSPIYTQQTVFDSGDPHPVAVSRTTVYGVTSLIVWSVVAIVTVTYVLLVMRADNEGEGGIMALITLVRRNVAGRTSLVLAALGIFGASLFLGDSMITPAISVLSAVEGLKTVSPGLSHVVIPITVVIVIGLFLVQKRGASAVGRLFGPVMVIWFAMIAALGVKGVVLEPAILRALSPWEAIHFVAAHFDVGFFALAAVVLAVTGAEALYADMGHFGRSAVTRAWVFLVFPACAISYLGQGALILHDHAAISGPFFELAPGWAQLPVVVVSTAATVIASQAVVTGAFSVAHQAVQLGYLPRLRTIYTSEQTAGQVYLPLVNWTLFVAVIVLILTFGSSAKLAFAFGMAVTGTITITTLLFLYLARHAWRWPLWVVAPIATVLLTIDGLFLAANVTKIVHGAWLPLAIALAAFTVLTTWQRGRAIVTGRRVQREGPLRAFVDALHRGDHGVTRPDGTAVFLNRTKETAPLAMRAVVEQLHTLPAHVVLLTVETAQVPHIAPDRRLVIDELGYADDGILHATARFGYADVSDVPAVLAHLAERGGEAAVDIDRATYFLSTIELDQTDAPGMSAWRKRLFLATATLTSDAADHFGLPRERTVRLGSRIPL